MKLQSKGLEGGLAARRYALDSLSEIWSSWAGSTARPFELVTCIDAIHLIIDSRRAPGCFAKFFGSGKPGGHYFLCAHSGKRTEVRGRQGGMRVLTVRVKGRPVQIRIPRVLALIKNQRSYVRELRGSGFTFVSAVTTRSDPIPAPVCVIDGLKEP